MTPRDAEGGREHPFPGADRSGEYARAIVETVRSPLLVLDGKLRVEAANPAFYRAFELEPELVLGVCVHELPAAGWGGTRFRSLLERVLPEAREIQDHELELGEGGERRIVLANAREIRLEGVGAHRILLALEDVTEVRRAQRDARRYARELERSNRELQDFAHAASHDLQEPLRKIRTYAGRLQAELGDAELGERAGRYLEGLGSATERMQQRITDLLQLARVRREDTSFEPLELGRVVADVLDDLEIGLREAGAEVEIGELPAVRADPAQMRLLFQNLLGNALKYRRPDGTPRLEVTGTVEEGADGPEARVVVADNGIGFEQEYAERIFRPFHRLHGRGEYEGSGVGLAVCRRVVDHHEGRIRAEGTPGEGARFIVELPVEPRLEETA